MTTINLLPWRQLRREELKKQFYYLLIVVGLVCLFMILTIHLYMNYRINQKVLNNKYLSQQINQLDERIEKIKNIRDEKRQLLERMAVIQELQHDRPNVVILFDDLVRVVPKGVVYSAIKRENKLLTIEGYAESNTRVSKLMRNMNESKLLENPALSLIREQEDKKGNKEKTQSNSRFFSLTVKQVDKT